MKRAILWAWRLDPTAGELLLAGAALAFGLALLVPVDLTVRSPAFRALVELLPQHAWALVWIACGVAQAVGAVGGWGRRQADVAAACLWMFWTAVQALWLGLTVGPFVYGWLALGAVIASHLERQYGDE